VTLIVSEAGYVDGQNVTVEYHWFEGHYDRLPGVMADLVRALCACSSVQGPARLLRRARDRAERAEHAAVAFFGAQPRAALRAVIK
jgi:hypothetical protein